MKLPVLAAANRCICAVITLRLIIMKRAARQRRHESPGYRFAETKLNICFAPRLSASAFLCRGGERERGAGGGGGGGKEWRECTALNFANHYCLPPRLWQYISPA